MGETHETHLEDFDLAGEAPGKTASLAADEVVRNLVLP